MLDRQKLEALLSKRFPGSKYDQIAAAANAIMGLDDEWEEVVDAGETMRSGNDAIEYRVLRRRVSV
jgi:hypothetical protein